MRFFFCCLLYRRTNFQKSSPQRPSMLSPLLQTQASVKGGKRGGGKEREGRSLICLLKPSSIEQTSTSIPSPTPPAEMGEPSSKNKAEKGENGWYMAVGKLSFFPLSPPFSYFLLFSAVSPFVGGNRGKGGDAQMDYGDACVCVCLWRHWRQRAYRKIFLLGYPPKKFSWTCGRIGLNLLPCKYPWGKHTSKTLLL